MKQIIRQTWKLFTNLRPNTFANRFVSKNDVRKTSVIKHLHTWHSVTVKQKVKEKSKAIPVTGRGGL
jgi:hypothetical protein